MINQFIISKKRIETDFKMVYIDNLFIYFNKIKFQIMKFNNKNLIIIGLIFRTDIITNDVLKNIKNIDELIRNTTGSYIIIYDNILYKYFLGTIEIFYDKKNMVISNDISLLNQNIKYVNINEQLEKLQSNIYFNLSPFILDKKYKIYRLNGFQILNLLNFSRNNNTINIIKKDIYTIKNILYETSNIIFHNMKLNNYNVVLSLSAGFDSRAMLQLLLNSNIEFKVYNKVRNISHVKYTDGIIPSILCKKFNIKMIDIKDFKCQDILIRGHDFEIYNTNNKDCFDFMNKKFSIKQILSKYIYNIPNFKSNLKYFNLYIKKYYKNINFVDLITLYFQYQNQFASYFYENNKFEINMIILFNNKTIGEMLLNYPFLHKHFWSNFIISDNIFLKNFPVNSLIKNTTNQMINNYKNNSNYFYNYYKDIKESIENEKL